MSKGRSETLKPPNALLLRRASWSDQDRKLQPPTTISFARVMHEGGSGFWVELQLSLFIWVLRSLLAADKAWDGERRLRSSIGLYVPVNDLSTRTLAKNRIVSVLSRLLVLAPWELVFGSRSSVLGSLFPPNDRAIRTTEDREPKTERPSSRLRSYT